MKTITLDAASMDRPNMQFEEVETEVGKVVGRNYWNAVHFKPTEEISEFDLCGHWDKITLNNKDECWEFLNAYVLVSSDHFCMTFKSVKYYPYPKLKLIEILSMSPLLMDPDDFVPYRKIELRLNMERQQDLRVIEDESSESSILGRSLLDAMQKYKDSTKN